MLVPSRELYKGSAISVNQGKDMPRLLELCVAGATPHVCTEAWPDFAHIYSVRVGVFVAVRAVCDVLCCVPFGHGFLDQSAICSKDHELMCVSPHGCE